MAAIINRLNGNKFEKLEKDGVDSLKKGFSKIDEQELLEDLLPNLTEASPFYSPITTPVDWQIPDSRVSQFSTGDLLRNAGVVFAPYAPLHVTTQVRGINHIEVNASEVESGYRGIINKIVEILRDGSYNK